MSSKISDDRLAELIEFHKENRRGTRLKEASDYYSDEVSALAELAEYRAREAESDYPWSVRYRDGWVPLPNANRKNAEGEAEFAGGTLVRRLIGPWEAVGDDAGE